MAKIVSKMHKLKEAFAGTSGQIISLSEMDVASYLQFFSTVPNFVIQTSFEDLDCGEANEIYREVMNDQSKRYKINAPFPAFTVEFSMKDTQISDIMDVDHFIVFVAERNHEDGKKEVVCVPSVHVSDSVWGENVWLSATSDYTLNIETGKAEIGTPNLPNLHMKPKIEEALKNAAKAAGRITSILCAMLASKSYDSERIEAPAKLNKQRILKGKPLLTDYDAVTLRLPAVASGSAGISTGTGSQKSPHERREHFRRLRDGREIPVKASKVHGGGGGAQQYNVTIKS